MARGFVISRKLGSGNEPSKGSLSCSIADKPDPGSVGFFSDDDLDTEVPALRDIPLRIRVANVPGDGDQAMD